MPHQCTSCGHVFADGSKEMLSGCPDCGGTKFQFHPEGTEIPDRPDPGAEPPDPPKPDDSVAGAVGNAAATVKDLVGRGSSGPSTEESPASADTADEAPGPDTGSGNVGGVALESEPSTQQPEATSTEQSVPTESMERAVTRDSAEIEAEPSAEDSAQASARTDVVSRDELPDSSGETEQDARVAETSTDHPTAPTTERPEAATTTDRPDTSTTADQPEESTPAGDSTVPETGASTGPDEQGSSAGTVVDEPDESDDRPDLSELRKELNEQFESIKVVEPGQYELNLMELYDREEYIIALEEDGKYSIQVPDRWQD